MWKGEKKRITLISELGWTSSKLITKYRFSFNLKFHKSHNFKRGWRTKLIIEIRSRSWQELRADRVSFKPLHKYAFYSNLKFLNVRHFQTSWLSKLNDELGWALGKNIMHIKFHSNRPGSYLNVKFLNFLHFETR